MARPRVHDPDSVLDAVEELAVQSGPAAVSIRAISAAAGVSNGAVYHSFSSRGGLMAHAWLRAGRRFLSVQRALVEEAFDAQQAAADAVVAAADAPVIFAGRYPNSAKLVLTVRRAEVLADDVSDDVAAELRDLDTQLVDLMVQLVTRLWDRKDAAAVDVITSCIVDLPTALLLTRNAVENRTRRAQLRAAVRAVLALGPPTPRALENRWADQGVGE